MPRQKFVQPTGGVIGDTGENIGEPSLRIDRVELGRHDQRRHRGCPISAPLRAGRQLGFSAQGKASQDPFGGVVGQADPSVFEEVREGRPTPQQIVDRLGHGRRARQA